MNLSCPLCGRKEIKWMFRKNSFDLLDCKNCRIAFISPMPTREDLKDFYSLEYFKGNMSKFGYVDYICESHFQEKTFVPYAKMIENYYHGGKILDVGCATGTFLKVFGQKWKKYGVDISEDILKEKSALSDVSFWLGDFLDYPAEPDTFDVITFWDVMDHVPIPDAFLTKAYRLLKRNGSIGISVGDRESLFSKFLGKRWHIYIPPTHLFFFTKTGLLKLLEKYGFRVYYSGYRGKWASINLCLFRLSYILPNSAFKKLYEVIRDSLAGQIPIYFNFRDVITILARKI